MGTTGRVLMVTAGGLLALALNSTVPGGTAAAQGAAGEPVSKTCRANRMPKRDVVVHEGDKLDLGDQHLTLHTAPGHTPGVMVVEGIVLHEGGKDYKAIWGGGAGGGPGLAGAQQGIKNTTMMAAIKGIQVNMQTHAWQPPNGAPGGGIHERSKLVAARKPRDPNPFVDSVEIYQQRTARALANAQRTLAEEQAKAAAAK